MNIPNQDTTLWESFRKGDRTAYAAIFRTHYDTLYLFGCKMTKDTELLEDCIQELFIEIWRAKKETPVRSVKAYLLKSLKYKLLKALREKGKFQAFSSDADAPFELSHENFLIQKQENDHRRQQVIHALGQLTNRQKEIIYLKYYHNLSYEEVSEIMNINYQVARNLLYTAIRSLKSMLGNILQLFFFL